MKREITAAAKETKSIGSFFRIRTNLFIKIPSCSQMQSEQEGIIDQFITENKYHLLKPEGYVQSSRIFPGEEPL